MLTLLVPILINYLLEGDQLQHASKYQLSLHQQSFQWLNKIGPKYPQVGTWFIVFKYMSLNTTYKFINVKNINYYYLNIQCFILGI